MYIPAFVVFVLAHYFCAPRTRMTQPHFQGTKHLSMCRTSLSNSLSCRTKETQTPWPTCRCRGSKDIAACLPSDPSPFRLTCHILTGFVFSQAVVLFILVIPRRTSTEILITFVYVTTLSLRASDFTNIPRAVKGREGSGWPRLLSVRVRVECGAAA